MIRWLLAFVGVCPHAHTYRERRKLHGVNVMHWVCEDCGHATEAVSRSASEHRKTVRAGAIRRPKAKRDQTPAEVWYPDFQRKDTGA